MRERYLRTAQFLHLVFAHKHDDTGCPFVERQLRHKGEAVPTMIAETLRQERGIEAAYIETITYFNLTAREFQRMSDMWWANAHEYYEWKPRIKRKITYIKGGDV